MVTAGHRPATGQNGQADPLGSTNERDLSARPKQVHSQLQLSVCVLIRENNLDVVLKAVYFRKG